MERRAAETPGWFRSKTEALLKKFAPTRLGRGRVATKAVALALQGGGSHGAFTWGVLDRLLEDERLIFDAISGASAGAMNGAVLASGWLDGGRDGARQALANFWQRVSEAGRLSSLGSSIFSWTPGGLGLQMLARATSPYQFNPLDLNPLRDLLEDHVDFDRLRRSRKIQLLISATNVHTGSPRVFSNREFSSDVLLASACLPHLYRAVEIDGAHYWDGGFTANPAILPLVQDRGAKDVVVVHVDTQGHPEVPTTTGEISDRLQRILMNAPLLREIQLIEEMKALADRRSDLGRRLRNIDLHHILPPPAMVQLETASKLKTDWTFLTQLRDIGRATAELWLLENYARIGSGRAAKLETTLLALERRDEAIGYAQG